MRNNVFLLCLVSLVAFGTYPLIAQNAGKAFAIPVLDDRKAIGEYLAKADLDARIRLYDAYFQRGYFRYGGVSALASSFSNDFEAAKPELRGKLAGFLLSAIKRPESFRDSEVDGRPRLRTMYFEETKKLLGLLAQHEETAQSYYAALPFGEQRDSGIEAVDLVGKSAAVFLAAAPTIVARLSPEGKRQVLAGVLAWPSRLKSPKYDVASLRALQKLLGAGDYAFFGAVANASEAFAGVDWKAFLAAAPTEEELAGLAPGLFDFAASLSSSHSAAALVLRVPKTVELGPILSVLSSSVDPRLKAISALARALRDAKAKGGASMADAVAAKDDWSAACLYRAAAIRGEQLSDDQLLACIDPSRPSLAAAVVEDRYGKEYFDSNDYASAQPPPTGAADPEVALRESVVKRCLALRESREPRVLVPVLRTIIVLGATKYVNEIYVLLPSAYPIVRMTAYQGLLRFADPAMLGTFLSGLSDPDNEVRLLCIRGLGAIKDSRGVDPLSRILSDPTEDAYIRTEAAHSLGEIGDRRAIQIFSAALLVPRGKDSGDFELRVIAAQYLGEAREKTAVEALLSNIDPKSANELNYRCLEALGKIDSQEADRKLLPIASEAWGNWLKGPGYLDNLYALCWALFLYKAPEAERLYAAIFDAAKAKDADATFVAAYYLARNAAKASPETLSYVEGNRSKFFSAEQKAYEFARLLEKRWDPESLLFMASRLDGYGSATQSWILGCMEAQPDPRFIDFMKGTRESPIGTIRDWTSSVAEALAKDLPHPATEEGKKTAIALLAFLSPWNPAEKDANTLSRIASARQLAGDYLNGNPSP
jgi:HEAT repeat protein